MMYSLAKPLRQALAVSLLVAVVSFVLMTTVVPVMARIGELEERIEQQRTILGRLTVAATDDGSSADARQRAVAARIGRLFLPGESEAIRVSYIQSQVVELLGKEGMKPHSTRNLPARERSGLRLVGVQFQISAPIEQLQALVHGIEAHQPPFLIEAIHITPVSSFGGSGDDTRGMLDARIDVYGIEPQAKKG